MAINSKLILYDNEALFRQDLAASKVLPTSIVFMKDTGRLWAHGEYFGGGVWENMLGKPDMSDYASALDGNVIPMVIGTQTTTTASWTGILPLSELKSGTTIRYWLPRTSASSVTLNLTLKGGGTTGAIACYYGGTTRLTTHYPAGSFIMLTYLEGALINGTAYTGWWAKANYVDGSESYTVRWNAAIKVGAEVTRYKLLVQGSDGRYYPTTIGNTTAGTKTISTVPFLIGSPIIFYLYTTTAAAGGVTSSSYNYTGVTTSTTTYAWNKVSGWRANEDVYLKGTVSGALFTLDNSTLTSHMTQDLPTTEDGFYYMRLGMFTNTTTGFRLSNQHPTYYFADGELQSLNTSHGADWNELLNKPTTFAPSAHTHSNFTRTVSGFVPAPGAATTTRYLREDGSWFVPPNTADTHWTTGIRAGASGTAANTAVTNPYIKVVDNESYREQFRLIGGSNVTVTSDASKNITITAVNTDTNTYVTQAVSTISTYKPILLGQNDTDSTANFSNVTNQSYYSNALRMQPSTGNIISKGEITATSFLGNATTATALTTNAGSATQPVYFSGGKPVAATAYASASVNYATTAGTATTATTASKLTVNSSASADWFDILWNSGTTIYGSTGSKLRVQPSTGSITSSGTITAAAFSGAFSGSSGDVTIRDTRGASRIPSYYERRAASWDFQESAYTGAGGDTWNVVNTISKWTSFSTTHRQEQIAYTGASLKHRVATSDTVWGSWNTILDSSNSYVSGNKISINGISTTWTHRGIQNNLTSSSTTESLSANQGRLLATGSARDETKFPISGGILEDYTTKLIPTTGVINLDFGNAFKLDLTTNTNISIVGAKAGAQSFTLIITTEWEPRIITFPNSVMWNNREIPDLSKFQAIYEIIFMTIDEGTKWSANTIKTSKLANSYELATDADFSGNSSSYIIYGGTKEYIVLPNTFKGQLLTSYSPMFLNNTRIKGVVNLNTNSVTSMSQMFTSCNTPALDLSSFNTNKVTNMSHMFSSCRTSALDLSSFNTSNVTDMSNMFHTCNVSTLDVNSFNTSKVTNMSLMFYSCFATALDLSNFNTSNVTDMNNMFYICRATTLDVSNFDTSNVTDMRQMFSGCHATTLDVSNFDTSNVTNMSLMFSGCFATALDLSNFNTSKVTNMSHMFSNCKMPILDLSSFNTSNVTSINEMFYMSQATIGYARTQADANKFNASSNKPAGLNFIVKP